MHQVRLILRKTQAQREAPGCPKFSGQPHFPSVLNPDLGHLQGAQPGLYFDSSGHHAPFGVAGSLALSPGSGQRFMAACKPAPCLEMACD